MSDTTDDGCCGCSRRTMMQGLVAASALVPLGACRQGDPELPGGDVDAPGGGDGGGGSPGFALCGPNLCVDLADPANAALANAGGSRVITAPTSPPKRIIVARVDATTFETLSAVCTHAGCSVRFTAASSTFNCPCHGSAFAIDGSVMAGPATRALEVFGNTFDAPTNLLTITL